MGIWIAGEAILWQLGLLGLPAAVYDDWLLEEERLTVTVSGTVEEWENTEDCARLILKDNSVSCRGTVRVPRRLLVYLNETGIWKIGNRVRVTGVLSHFSLPGNPGEFDVRGYYRSQGIDYSVQGKTWELAEDSVDRPREFLAGLRRTFKENILRAAGEEDAGVLAAVFLGDTSLLPEETKKLYQEGGIAHILAVSGLHVSLLGMGIFRILLCLPLPKRLPEILGAALMAGYVAVAGASVSSRRAWILFFVMLLARVLGRSYDTLSALGLAGLFLLSFQPMQLFQAGFQLSFGTVACLGLLSPELSAWCRPKRPWERALLSSLCATVGTMPVAAWHFYQVSLSGIWLNLLALPLSSFLLLSAALTAVCSGILPAAGVFFAGTGHYILVFYRFLCEFGGKSVRTGRPEGWQAAAFYGLLLLFVAAGRAVKRRESVRRKANRQEAGWRKSIHGKGDQQEAAGQEAVLRGAVQRRVERWKTVQQEATGQKADLRGAVRRKAERHEAVGQEAVLRGAVQRRVERWKAVQQEATGQETDLRGAVRRKADRHEAVDQGAGLRGAAPHNAGRQEEPPAGEEEWGAGKRVLRYAALAAASLFLLALLLPIPDRGLTVVSLDVGQGDCSFLRTPEGNCWLIDGGSSSVSGVGERRILPFLKFEGVGKLEGVVLSHSDEDHINGVEELLESGEIRIGCLILPRASSGEPAWARILDLASMAGVPVRYMEAGQRFSDGAVSFSCLHPSPAFTGTDANSLSLVLEVEAGGFRGLFPGDLGTAEEDMFRSGWSPLTVLKVGHHGSRGSSGEAFLETVRPAYAVISCGKKNSYGHPHPELLERLEEAGSRILRTDEDGAIRFFIRSGTIRVTAFRQAERKKNSS